MAAILSNMLTSNSFDRLITSSSQHFFCQHPLDTIGYSIHLSVSQNGQTILKNSLTALLYTGYIMCLSGIQYDNSILLSTVIQYAQQFIGWEIPNKLHPQTFFTQPLITYKFQIQKSHYMSTSTKF